MSGNVTTLAGGTSWGVDDGIGTSASFSYMRGIDVSVSGIVFVADTDNHILRMISPTGTKIDGRMNLLYLGGTFINSFVLYQVW